MIIAQAKRSAWGVFLCVVLVGLVTLGLLGSERPAEASTSTAWEDVYSVTVSSTTKFGQQKGESWHMTGCSPSTVIYETASGVSMEDACIINGHSVRLAVLLDANRSTQYALMRQGDVRFHQILDFSSGPFNPVFLRANTFLFASPKNLAMTKVDDIATSVEPVVIDRPWGTDTKYYKFIFGHEGAKSVHDSTWNYPAVRRIDVSNNGNYAVAEVYWHGIGVVNLQTPIMRYIADDTITRSGVQPEQYLRLAVSNSGKRLAVVSADYKIAKLYILDGECGGGDAEKIKAQPRCDSIDFSDKLKAQTMLNGASLYGVNFTDENTLVLRADVKSYPGAVVEVTIRPNPNALRFKYLAMGDSVSSGEGDTAKDRWGYKYYRAYTDNEAGPRTVGNTVVNMPREKCHLSTRSYPYRIANMMGMAKDVPREWDSVACSGARTDDIKSGNLPYRGQKRGGSSDGDRPRLENRTDVEALQTTALNEVIPGRVEQVEFVRKYKPRTITLTLGANNIDFANKLNDCVTSLGTCKWATSLKPALASQIQGEYDSLKTLYEELHQASGSQAKIYVVGYPQLISMTEPASCGNNTGSLSREEREMIYQATRYFNLVIERAANAAGVKYVDVSDALLGGRLCDKGQAYMTGIAAAGSSELQESFHPNSAGHLKIAQSISVRLGGKTFQQYQICSNGQNACPKSGMTAQKPPVPDYLGGSPEIKSKNATMTQSTTTRKAPISLFLPSFLLRPGSTLRFMLYSDPVDLGEYTVDGGGGLTDEIIIPTSVPVGYHTLVATGVDYSGEPIELTQTVLVVGDNPDDQDDNGVLDAEQVCGPFILASNIDEDRDGIDDACDPSIEAYSEIVSPGVVADINWTEAHYGALPGASSSAPSSANSASTEEAKPSLSLKHSPVIAIARTPGEERQENVEGGIRYDLLVAGGVVLVGIACIIIRRKGIA